MKRTLTVMTMVIALAMSMMAPSVAGTNGADDGCKTLIAGQNIDVGEVCITDNGETLKVTYTIDDPWQLSETHLAVSTDEPPNGEWTENGWQNKSGNPAPGQFPYSETHDPLVDEFTYEIPFDDIGAEPDFKLHVAAHAVAQKTTVIEEGGYYADNVDASDQGVRIDLASPDAERSFDMAALVQDYPGSPYGLGFFSLGFKYDDEAGVFADAGGEIKVSFECPVTTGEGPDLRIWEVTFGGSYPEEKAEVFAWDGEDWVSLGFADNSQQGPEGSPDALTVSEFELPEELMSTDQIKVVDTTDSDLFDGTTGRRRANGDGFDLEAIEALQDCTEVQTETAWGAGNRFVDRGNWATYFTYQTNRLFTGQLDSAVADGITVDIPDGDYHLTVSGTWLNTPHWLVDAVCVEQGSEGARNGSLDASDRVWLRTWESGSYDDPPLFGDVLVDGVSPWTQTDDDCPDANHTYSTDVTVSGGSVKLTVFDSFYGDNVGLLDFTFIG